MTILKLQRGGEKVTCSVVSLCRSKMSLGAGILFVGCGRASIFGDVKMWHVCELFEDMVLSSSLWLLEHEHDGRWCWLVYTMIRLAVHCIVYSIRFSRNGAWYFVAALPFGYFRSTASFIGSMWSFMIDDSCRKKIPKLESEQFFSLLAVVVVWSLVVIPSFYSLNPLLFVIKRERVFLA